ncbi:hypothetical protein AGOR_G00049280 [Albula goreensis]|uniref:Vitamin D-binding protein n=1 Tax=Albula goreensis TaxID=1534307 RepID=A0A8T3DU38_9TELE|nr:hypothetical protein AGOR_G00049280 [Albula goreensis]
MFRVGQVLHLRKLHVNNKMRILTVVALTCLFTLGASSTRGKNYEKETVCEVFRAAGKEKFMELFTVLYSQKFPNGTFEEVRCVADEMTKLAGRCCGEDASSDCYDKGATQISEKSCGKDSPFPKHPGISKCCREEGLERKLCLASLRYTAEELPSLLKPTNEEICEQYKQNASGYSARYLYEFARRHRSTPAGLVLNATGSHIQMAEKCCSPAVSNACFLNERLQQREANIFLRFTSNVCNNQVNLKSHKTGLTVYYGSLLGVPFEEAVAIASTFEQGLAKCCLDPKPQCIINEFTEFHRLLCNESTVTNKPAEFQKCCSKPPLVSLTCMDDLKRQPHKLTANEPLPSDLCIEASPDPTDRYLFGIGVNYSSVSMPVMASLSDHFKRSVGVCCAGDDVRACLDKTKDHLQRITAFVSKADDLCSQYFKLDFPAFVKKVQRDIQTEQPQYSQDDAKVKAEAIGEFASTCCFRHSPAVQCQKMTEGFITHGEDDSAV